jgi:hypothetical protein
MLQARRSRVRFLMRHGRRWENSIKIDLKQTGCGDVDLTHLAQNWDQCKVYVSTALNLRVPYNSGIYRLAEQLLASEKDSAPWR